MNPFNQLNEQLNLMIEEALSHQGGSIHINTADAKIIIELNDEKVVTVIYQKGTAQKVWHHALGSCTELMSSTKEIVLFLISKLKSVLSWRLLFKPKLLRIEYQPNLEHDSK